MNKQYLKRITEECGAMVVFGLAGFLVGILSCFVIVKHFGQGDPETTTAMIATFLGTMIMGMFYVFFGTYGMRQEFDLAVGMSQTRKSFIKNEFIVSTILTLVGIIVFFVLYGIDSLIQNTVYRGYVLEMDAKVAVDFMLRNPFNTIAIFLVLITVRMVFGSLNMIFGPTSIAIGWISFSAIMMLVGKFSRNPIVQNILQSITGAILWTNTHIFSGFIACIVTVICVAVLWGCVILLRKQSVVGV